MTPTVSLAIMQPIRRTLFSAWTVVCGLVACTSIGGVAGDASAQVVQLPAAQTFGYSGAVTVPDSGQAYLGGVRRHGSGAATRGIGPVAGRAASSVSGGTAMSASASIIDLQAMDEAILNAPTAKRSSNYMPRSVGTPVMNTLTPHLYQRHLGADQLVPPNDPNAWEIALGGGAVSQIGPANRFVRDDSNVRYFMLRAKEAHDAGRPAAALVYYRMAYERLTSQQRERLHEIQAKADAEGQADRAFTSGTAPAGIAAASAAGAEAVSSAAPASTAPASSAAGSEAGAAAPPAEEENANPFASPF